MTATIRLISVGKIKDQLNGAIVIYDNEVYIINKDIIGTITEGKVYKLFAEIPFSEVDDSWGSENWPIEVSQWKDILDDGLIDKKIYIYKKFTIIDSSNNDYNNGYVTIEFSVEEKLYTQKQFDAEYHRGFDNGFSEAFRSEYEW